MHVCAHTHTPTLAVAAKALKVFSPFYPIQTRPQHQRINEAKTIFHFNDLLLSLKNHFLKSFQGGEGHSTEEEEANLNLARRR